jgi:Cyclin, N-terminal domain
MQYCTSTQAKSWMFTSLESLLTCKQQALLIDSNHEGRKSKTCVSNYVRKFASGFQRRNNLQVKPDFIATTNLSTHDQDILIQFHAHQLQFLIGPNAILYDLRTNEKVLSTAIIFFRRFYLSNSIVDIKPRKIAAACAFFAAKVEEDKVEVREKTSYW